MTKEIQKLEDDFIEKAESMRNEATAMINKCNGYLEAITTFEVVHKEFVDTFKSGSEKEILDIILKKEKEMEDKHANDLFVMEEKHKEQIQILEDKIALMKKRSSKKK